MSGNGLNNTWLAPGVVKPVVAGGRFVLSGLNLGMTVVFSLWLLINAFTMDKITGVQTFKAMCECAICCLGVSEWLYEMVVVPSHKVEGEMQVGV